jgi:hypothetical protein
MQEGDDGSTPSGITHPSIWVSGNDPTNNIIELVSGFIVSGSTNNHDGLWR